MEEATDELLDFFAAQEDKLARPIHRVESLRVLIDQGGEAERRMLEIFGDELAGLLEQVRKKVTEADVELVLVEHFALHHELQQCALARAEIMQGT